MLSITLTLISIRGQDHPGTTPGQLLPIAQALIDGDRYTTLTSSTSSPPLHQLCYILSCCITLHTYTYNTQHLVDKQPTAHVESLAGDALQGGALVRGEQLQGDRVGALVRRL